ncbi:MAG: class I SAM-dependent methyltransferase, partial [Candidatus Levyibacteriota bacterium]
MMTQTEWDTKATTYTNAWEFYNAKGIAAHERLEKILDEYGVFTPDDEVLDIACGKGTLFLFAQKIMGPTGHIVAVDSSLEMLKFAQANAEQLGMAQQVTCVWADATTLPLDGQQFDKVVVFNAFPHFAANQTQAIQHWATFLKPGGSLFIIHSQSREKLNAMHEGKGFDINVNALPTQHQFSEMFTNAGLS